MLWIRISTATSNLERCCTRSLRHRTYLLGSGSHTHFNLSSVVPTGYSHRLVQCEYGRLPGGGQSRRRSMLQPKTLMKQYEKLPRTKADTLLMCCDWSFRTSAGSRQSASWSSSVARPAHNREVLYFEESRGGASVHRRGSLSSSSMGFARDLPQQTPRSSNVFALRAVKPESVHSLLSEVSSASRKGATC